MPRRPLVSVSALTVADYLLWNWSLNGSHDILALVSGLTLPPLALACLWLLTLSLVQLLAGAARRPLAPLARERLARARRSARSRGAARTRRRIAAARAQAMRSGQPTARAPQASGAERREPSHKIAA